MAAPADGEGFNVKAVPTVFRVFSDPKIAFYNL